MLYKFLLVILVIDAFVLIATILLQSGKGSGLAANFGGASSSPDAFIGIRQAGTILTKATWWSAGIFLGLAFVLQIMSTQTAAPKSVLEKTFSNQPASGGTSDQRPASGSSRARDGRGKGSSGGQHCRYVPERLRSTPAARPPAPTAKK